jgi:hypothetical protein
MDRLARQAEHDSVITIVINKPIQLGQAESVAIEGNDSFQLRGVSRKANLRYPSMRKLKAVIAA